MYLIYFSYYTLFVIFGRDYVPIVIPKLPHYKNNPFENSGASGAAEVIQY